MGFSVEHNDQESLPIPCRICGAIPIRRSTSIIEMTISLMVYPCNCMEEEERQKKEEEKWELLLRKAKIPPRYYTATLEPTDYNPQEKSLLPVCNDLVSRISKSKLNGPHQDPLKGIGFLGDTGLGKTYYLCAILIQLIRQGNSCIFLSIPEYFSDLKGSFSAGPETEFYYEKILSISKDTEIAALDDVGAEYGSQWAIDELGKIINHRYNYGMLTMFSSNLMADELTKRIGARTMDRLKEMCNAYLLRGKSLRGKKK